MIFESIDGYLLDGTPSKVELVRELLAQPSDLPEARPFYEGLRMLGARTPDLAICALRLALAGIKPDDAAVARLRALADRARSGDAQARTEFGRRTGGFARFPSE